MKLVVCLAAVVLGLALHVQANTDSFAAFDAWRGNNPSAHVEEGVKLAQQRVDDLMALAAKSAGDALQILDALTLADRAALPAAVQAVLETVVDVHSDVDVLHCVPSPTDVSGDCSRGAIGVMVTIDGERMAAVGTDLPSFGHANIPLHGYVLQGSNGRRLFVKMAGHMRCTGVTEESPDGLLHECFVGSRRMMVTHPSEATAAGSRERHLGSLSPSDRSMGTRKTCVFMVDFDDTTKNWASLGKSTATEFAAISTSATDTANKLSELSFGRVTIQLTIVSTIYTIKYSAITSDAGSIWTEVDRVLAANPSSGIATANYDFVAVYFPSTVPAFSAWAGLGSMPGKYSWFQYSSSYVWLHEWGHNMGFAHANARGSEYNNQFDVMGGGSFADAYGVEYRQGAGWVDDSKVTELSQTAEYPEFAAAGAPVKMAEVTMNTINHPSATANAARPVGMRTVLDVNAKNYLYFDIQSTGTNANKASVYTGAYSTAVGPTELEDIAFATSVVSDAGLAVGSSYAWAGPSFQCCSGTRIDTVAYTGPRVVFQSLSAVTSATDPYAMNVRGFFVDSDGTRLDGLGCVGTTCEKSFAEIVLPLALDTVTTYTQSAATDRAVFRVPLANPARVAIYVCASTAGVSVTTAGYRSYRPPVDVAMYGAALLTGALATDTANVVACSSGFTPVSTIVSDATATGFYVALNAATTGVTLQFKVAAATGIQCSDIQITVPSTTYLNGIYSINPTTPTYLNKPVYQRSYFTLSWRPNQWCMSQNCLGSTCGIYACGSTNNGANSIFDLTTLGGSSTVTCACPAGSYDPNDGSHTCAVCPMFTTSPAGSMAASACVCAPGYQPKTGATGCEICPANTYKSATGNTACTACPTGTSAPAGSQSSGSCQVLNMCKRMSFVSGSSWKDTYTLKGVFNGRGWYEAETLTLGSGRPTLFFSGQWYMSDMLNPPYYYDTWASTAWTVEQLDTDIAAITISCKCDVSGAATNCACVDGQVAVGGVCTGCGDGTYYSTATKACAACPAFTTTVPGETIRATCNQLTCRTLNLASTASDWYVGQYRFKEIAADGTWKYSRVADTTYEWYSPKTVGGTWYLFRNGNTGGYYAAGVAGENYNILSQATKSGAATAWTWTCVDCNAGYYFSSGQCLACPAGQSSAAGATSCGCSVGRTLSGSSCVACPANTYKSTIGSAACTACASGLVPNSDASACICPSGKVLGADGVTCVDANTKCGAGQQAGTISGNTVTCVACPTGTYSTGGVACQSCPQGMASSSATANACACKPGLVAYQSQGCFLPNRLTVAGSTIQPAIAGTYNLVLNPDGSKVYRSSATGFSFVKSSLMGEQWALVPSEGNPTKRIMYSSDNVTLPSLSRGWRIYHPTKLWFVAEAAITVSATLVGTPAELGGGSNTGTCSWPAPTLFKYKNNIVTTVCSSVPGANCNTPDFVVANKQLWIATNVQASSVTSTTCPDNSLLWTR